MEQRTLQVHVGVDIVRVNRTNAAVNGRGI